MQKKDDRMVVFFANYNPLTSTTASVKPNKNIKPNIKVKIQTAYLSY